MRYVDFEPARAREAATACRDAADVLRRVVTELQAGSTATDWHGATASRTREDVGDLAGALHAEAARLDATADDVEAAIGSAERAEQSRAAEAARRAEEARRAAETSGSSTSSTSCGPR